MKILAVVSLILGCTFALVSNGFSRQGSAQGRSTGVSISPLQIRKVLLPGAVPKDHINVQSLEEVAMRVTVRINSVTFADWTYIPNFGVRHARDAFPWFAKNAFVGDLQPFGKLEIPVEAVVPRSVRGRSNVFWAMVTVDLTVPSQPGRILPSFQIPIIYLVGKPIRAEVQIGSPELIANSGAATAFVPFTNVSQGYTPIAAYLTVRNLATGRIVTTTQQAGRNLYPESRRKLPFSLGPIGAGQYSITARAEIGTRRLPAVTANFTISGGTAHQMTSTEVYTIAPVLIDPSLVNEVLTPGARRSVLIQITNTSLQPLTVGIVPRSLSQANTGSLELSETALPTGVSLFASPDRVLVGPKQTTNVRLVLQVDRSARGENCFGIAVQDLNSKSSFSGMAVAVLTVKGTLEPKLELVPGAVRRNGGYPYSVEYSIVNGGNQALQPVYGSTLFDNGGTRMVNNLAVPPLGDGSILPGARLENKVAIPPGLKAGTYVVEIDYQYGTDLRTSVRVPFKIEKPITKGRG